MEVLFSICRKFLLIDQKYRLTVYAILLLVVSSVTDYHQPMPKTYFAQSRNFLNTYIVKYCWGWTSMLTGVFITSAYCGNRLHLVKSFVRLAVATAIWFIWTNLFNMIDKYTGQCTLETQVVLDAFRVKRSCVKNGGKWDSFDISGHSFLLIWCILFITEESNAINAWHYSKEIIRHELQHGEKKTDSETNNSGMLVNTTLKSLSANQLQRFKTICVESQFVEILFMGLALLTLFWEMMLFVTVLYFHTMIEKVIAGLIASFMWYIMYRKIPEVKLSSAFPVSVKLKDNFANTHAIQPAAEKAKSDSKMPISSCVNQPMNSIQRSKFTETEKVLVDFSHSNETPRLYSLNIRNLETEEYKNQRKCNLQNKSIRKKLRALHYIN